MFLVTHPDTNPAREGLTLVNFSITKLSDAQRARLSTCQPRSQCFSLPIYFFQSFWVQLFASNHMSFQAIYPRLLPWHYNDRPIPKQYRALLELHITQGQIFFVVRTCENL